MTMAAYAYSNTRIRVMKSLLLNSSDLDMLTRTKNLNSYLMSLRQTGGSSAFEGIEKASIHEIEKKLSGNIVKTIEEVIRISPKNCTPLITALLRGYKFEHIKLIINSRIGNLPAEEIRDMVRLAEGDPSHKQEDAEEFLSELIEHPVEDISALLGNKYPGLAGFIPKSSDLLGILTALDRYYFSELWDAAKHLGGSDRKVASMLISMEIEITNIMTILRSITQGYDALKFIIPCDNPQINELGKNPPNDVTDVITRLSKTAYGPLLEDAVSVYKETNSLLQMELTLKRYLVEKSKALMDEYPFQIGFILGFLRLKELEIENLRAIGIGIDEGLPANKITELLIMPP